MAPIKCLIVFRGPTILRHDTWHEKSAPSNVFLQHERTVWLNTIAFILSPRLLHPSWLVIRGRSGIFQRLSLISRIHLLVRFIACFFRYTMLSVLHHQTSLLALLLHVIIITTSISIWIIRVKVQLDHTQISKDTECSLLKIHCTIPCCQCSFVFR